MSQTDANTAANADDEEGQVNVGDVEQLEALSSTPQDQGSPANAEFNDGNDSDGSDNSDERIGNAAFKLGSLSSRYSDEVQHDETNNSNKRGSDVEDPEVFESGHTSQSLRAEFHNVDQSVNLMDAKANKYDENMDMSTNQDQKRSMFTDCGSFWYFVLVGCCALVVLSLFLCSLLLFKLQSENSSQKALGTSMSPEQRQKSFENIFLDHGITTKENLDDPTNPAYHAMDWLVHTDPARIQPNDVDSLEEERALGQRFASATLFFALRPSAALSSDIRGQMPIYSVPNHQQDSFGMLDSKSGSDIAVDDKQWREGTATATYSGSTPTPGRWLHENRWMTQANICDWFGVQCKDVSGKGVLEIVGVNLTSNQMVGAIPIEIFQMPTLQVLDLSNNGLVSELQVHALGDVEMTLQHLDLSRNRLVGTIPSTIARFTALEKIRLEENQFIGDIPQDLCALKEGQLGYLSVDCGEVVCTCCNNCGRRDSEG